MMMKLSTTTTTLAFSIALLYCATDQATTTLAFAPPSLRQNSAFHQSTKVSAVSVKAPSSISHGGNPSSASKKKKSKRVVIDSAKKMRRPKWGVDKDNEDEYWFNTQIHVFGNTGFLGAFHAAIAPISTKMIDNAAYEGQDVRKKLAQDLAGIVGKQKARVADLCCGVGISTRALQDAFPDAETILGIDTSPEMISMAQFITRHLAMVKPLFQRAANHMKDSYTAMQQQRGGDALRTPCYRATRFVRSNAEDTKLPARSFDLVTIMYGFHEAPAKGRERILKEAHRLLAPGGTLAVIDISTDYEPSPSMLAGEPYVQEYQQNIRKQLQLARGFAGAKYRTIVPKHLGMWTLKRTAVV